MVRTLVFLSLLVLGFASVANASSHDLSEQGKISYLLNAIGTSKLAFVRNGTEYSAAEAKAHLQMKLDDAADNVRTVDDFINKIASRSSMTGEPYYVKLPDGTMMESEKWLRDILDRLTMTFPSDLPITPSP